LRPCRKPGAPCRAIAVWRYFMHAISRSNDFGQICVENGKVLLGGNMLLWKITPGANYK
jgi:hypothetical protein